LLKRSANNNRRLKKRVSAVDSTPQMLRASKLSRVRAAALTHDGLRQLDGCMIVAIPRNAIR
jgi:hypothetical protein